jgi:hypothetical protein
MQDSRSSAWLEPGEAVVDHWPAATTTARGRAALTGGTLFLTTRRLAFVPVSLDPPATPLPTMSLPLDHVATVTSGAERGGLLLIGATDGSSLRYLVSPTRWTPLWSRKNAPFRDAVVSRLRAAVPTGPTG